MNTGGGDRKHIPEFHRIRTSMTHTKLEHVPAVPHTVDDITIHYTWRETWSGDNFFLHQDNDWSILVFTTDEHLICLQRCQEVYRYMDGTFRTAPSPYRQYFSIHRKYRNRVICLVNVLMTGQLIGQCRQILQVVKQNVRRISRHRWRLNLVIPDFEQSLFAAVETELPNSRISGCYFHFGHNLWRRVQFLGLARDYRQNRRLKKTIRKVIAIGYLPMALVRQNFLQLITSRTTRRLQRQFPELLHFFNFFEANYLNGIIVPQMSNVYERNMDTRTNNYVESK